MWKKNTELLPHKPLSPWRKAAIATWRSGAEASIYGWVNIEASAIIEIQEKLKDAGTPVSLTAIAAKAVAVSFHEYPIANSVLRWGTLRARKDIDIFMQVAPDDKGDNLSGLTVRQCDTKSLEEISIEIRESASRIKSGDDKDFEKIKKTMRYTPSWIIAIMVRIISFFLYQLNIWSPIFGTPRDMYGSAMVTSVGVLGLQRGLAPLVPYSPCPLVVTIGKLEEKPLAENGEVVIKTVLPVCATFDHRLIDGVGAARLMKGFQEYMKAPY